MEPVFELEIYSRPETRHHQDFGKTDLAPKIIQELNLSPDVVCGLTNLPSDVDCHNLRTSISDGELDISGFNQFCEEHRLIKDTNNTESAEAYLCHCYGTELAWLHLPHNHKGLEILYLIEAWAIENGFNVQSTHYSYCLNPNIKSEPEHW
ncbi:hypothetical protein [Pseudoalteromonas sp. GB56]